MGLLFYLALSIFKKNKSIFLNSKNSLISDREFFSDQIFDVNEALRGLIILFHSNICHDSIYKKIYKGVNVTRNRIVIHFLKRIQNEKIMNALFQFWAMFIVRN